MYTRVCVCVCVCVCVHAQSCPTLCNLLDLALQAPPSMEFSRQEHWSELPYPSLGNPALSGGFFTTRDTWQTMYTYIPSFLAFFPI